MRHLTLQRLHHDNPMNGTFSDIQFWLQKHERLPKEDLTRAITHKHQNQRLITRSSKLLPFRILWYKTHRNHERIFRGPNMNLNDNSLCHQYFRSSEIMLNTIQTYLNQIVQPMEPFHEGQKVAINEVLNETLHPTLEAYQQKIYCRAF